MKNRYIIRVNKTAPIIEMEGMIIGDIYDSIKQKPIMDIALNDWALRLANQRFMAVRKNTNPEIDAKAIISISYDAIEKIRANDPMPMFCFLHELCHLLKNHINSKNAKSRADYIKNNTVQECELEADAFAAEQMGKDAAINALRSLQQDRKDFDIKNNNQSKPNAILVQKEYELRIKAIENLEIK